MKPKTIKSILEEVAFHYERERPSESNEGLGVYEAKDQLIELFMSCVPEEKSVDTANNAVANSNYYGFNSCRNQMIKNLEKLK